ncbi:MAG: YecA family protein [Gammaproteobacteria bacterium]|nr:YecA family protein [Gammaproteobacteria bacterium]
MSDKQTPAHAQVSAALDRVSSPVSASGCHGLMCGILSIRPAARPESWLGEVMPDADPADLLVQESSQLLQLLFDHARDVLASPEMGFTPLLPGDDEPLLQRSRALAEWCDGFLYGLGLGGYDGGADRHPEEQEFVADLHEFTKIGASQGGEADEQALVELIEYIRIGVLMISTMPAAAGGQTNTLH